MSLLDRLNYKAKYYLNAVYKRYVGYIPYYNRYADIASQEPEIYNRNGERMRVFFLADTNFAHDPYGITFQDMNYILWDRYNFGLKTHFYTGAQIFRPTGNPDRRFAVQIEPPSIEPGCYDRIIKHKSYIESEFDTLFTDSGELLSAVKNAKFFPACSSYWYGKIDKSVKVSPDAYKYKNRGISILASNKTRKLHLIRQETARRCLANNWADAFGTFTHGGGM